MKIKLERNIPIPSRRRSSGLKSIMDQMEIDRDSFTYPKQLINSISGTGNSIRKDSPEKRFVIRTISKDMIRVWRIA